MKVKLSDVKIAKLNGTSLSLIAKFARVLKAHDGTILQLTSPDVVKEVIQHARKTRNAELRKLGNMLVREIRNHLIGEGATITQYPVFKKLDEASLEDAQTAGYRRL